MTSRQHAAWIARGKPWRLARPLQQQRDRLRAYGYTVYDLGNDAHLDHIPPERHCPYCETNWSAFQNRPMPDVVTAIDIMPRTVGMANRGLPTLQQIGAQYYADKQAGHSGVAWLIGMNWGPSSDRTAVRDTWRPSHVRSTSSDTGHIHGECDSSMIDSTAGDTYDPVARIKGLSESTGGNENMDRLVIVAGTPHQCVSDGKTYRWLPDGASVARAVAAYGLNSTPVVVQESDLGTSVDGKRPGGVPVSMAPAAALTFDESSVQALADALAARGVTGTLHAGQYTVTIAPAG